MASNQFEASNAEWKLLFGGQGIPRCHEDCMYECGVLVVARDKECPRAKALKELYSIMNGAGLAGNKK